MGAQQRYSCNPAVSRPEKRPSPCPHAGCSISAHTMKTIRLLFAATFLTTPVVAVAQSFYAILKGQNFVQTSASAVVANSLQPFYFQALAGTAATLTLPGGGTEVLHFDASEGWYQMERVFPSKPDLDAAFPNGAYRMSGPAIPTLSLNVAADSYSLSTPQIVGVTNGAWNSGGVLVVDPSQPVTLNFSTFSDYAASGAIGHVVFEVIGFGDDVELEAEVASQSFFEGVTVQPSPLGSYTIPARTFTQGRVYAGSLQFNRVPSLNNTIIPGSVVGVAFWKESTFYIAAQTPGTTTPPPVITTQPANRTATLGGSVSFSLGVTVGGSGQLGQLASIWRHNGLQIDGNAEGGAKYRQGPTMLTINNLTAADAGSYTVTLVNAGGVVTSAAATLSFGAAGGPAILFPPRGATVNAGTTVALTVGATGSPAPAFQWRKDGAAIAGATSDTLVLASVAPADTGYYSVVVSNSGGSATSAAALLAVSTGQPGRLSNLSVRANLAASQTLIVGFATSGAKTMLVRAVGPTLNAFGLSGTLSDPEIELYDSAAAMIDENNDWSPALAPMFVDVGAFALNSGSRDAALQRLCSGAHTAQIKGNGSGVVLVEVYDAAGSGKLVNVSARNAVGTGDNILIAGFVVDGVAAKTVLIRAVGARLAEFGITGVLADPRLEIYDAAAVKLAENDSWSLSLQTLARSVGAFDLTPGSRDAALLLTLSPGAYTAQISGVGGGTGEGLVEVYEIP